MALHMSRGSGRTRQGLRASMPGKARIPFGLGLLAWALLGSPAFASPPQSATSEGRGQAQPFVLVKVESAVEVYGSFPFRAEDRVEFADPSYDDTSWRRVLVPAIWTNIGLRHSGIAWYRFDLRLAESVLRDGRDLGVMVPYILAAHEVYVNGRLLGGRGVVSTDPLRARFSTMAHTVRVPRELLSKGRNVLAFRVQPYTSVGGIALPDFYVGTHAAVQERFQRYLVWNSLLAGACLLVGLYFLTIYLAQRRDRSFLYFSLTAFLAFLYAAGSKSIDYYAHDLGNASFLLHESTIQMGLAATPICLLRFYENFFGLPRRWFSDLLGFGALGLGALFLLSFLSDRLYEFHLWYLFPAVFGIGICLFVYFLYVNVRCVGARMFGARTVLVGMTLFFLALANDLLHHLLVLKGTSRLYEEGFTALTITMAVAVGMKLSATLAETDRLNRTLDATVLERTRELREAARNAEHAGREIQKLNDFTRKINETRDLGAVIEYIAAHVRENFDIDGLMIHLLDRKSNELRFLTVSGEGQRSEEQREFVRGQVFPLDERGGMVARIVQRGRPMYLSRFRDVSDQTDPVVALRRIAGVESAMIVPLVVQQAPIGVLFFSNFDRKMTLDRNAIASLERFGEQIAGAVYSSSLLHEVQQEQQKANELLLNILPGPVADELKTRGAVAPMNYDHVTVVFTDFVGFTGIAQKLPPEALIEELDGCFTQFDEITARYGLEKLKTIGDAYMCAGGLPVANHTNPVDACLAALEFQAFMSQMQSIKKSLGLPFWSLRIGMHCGPVTAGIVGKNKFAYDIWGDTVNTASRLESTADPMTINISAALHECVRDFFVCDYRGPIEAKGKGQLEMFFLRRLLPELSRDAEGRLPNASFREKYARL